MGRTIAVAVLLLGLAGCGSPDIEWQCTMNGFGVGSCSFTNTGDGAGAVCGSIEVYKANEPVFEGTILGEPVAESGKFCSGEVGASTTNQVEFRIASMREVCGGTLDKAWTEVCKFTFVPTE